MRPFELTGGKKAGDIIGVLTLILMMVAGVLLAYRNYVRGKGDRQGAFRLAAAVFAVEMGLFLCAAHFVPALVTVFLFILAVSGALFMSGFMWVLYLALEPYVRRRWPQTIISWSRLTAGRVRDPLVGRDLLSGMLLGMAWILVFQVGILFLMRAGARPEFSRTEYLLGVRETAAAWLGNGVGSILGTLIFFFVLVLLRVLVRNRWLAAVLFVVINTAPKLLASDYPAIETPIWLIIYAIAAVAVVRFGLIVLATATFMTNVLLNLPCTLNFSDWYITSSIWVLLSFVALVAWGFYTSLGGKKLWKDELFE